MSFSFFHFLVVQYTCPLFNKKKPLNSQYMNLFLNFTAYCSIAAYNSVNIGDVILHENALSFYLQ